MASIFNNSNLMRLFIMVIIMNWNVEANPINTQWNTQKPFQIVENNIFSGKFLHITGKFKQYLFIC
jgi:hypothetical protein